jgi:hypothetical protein
LWHQLTKKIEEFIRDGNFSEGDELMALYEFFIVDFQQKINWLSLVQISLAAAKQCKGTFFLCSLILSIFVIVGICFSFFSSSFC